MDIFTYFKRSNIKNGATKIYPRWLGLVVFLLEFLAVFIVYYFRKIQKIFILSKISRKQSIWTILPPFSASRLSIQILNRKLCVILLHTLLCFSILCLFLCRFFFQRLLFRGTSSYFSTLCQPGRGCICRRNLS